MGSIRLTLALNANRNIKTILLVSTGAPHDPEDSASVRALVIKHAQSKLRLKLKKGVAGRTFAARNGAELLTTDDWKREAVNDAVLLVSAGEDFVGLKKDDATTGSTAASSNGAAAGNPDCSIAQLADSAYVDQLAITQLETTARTLPGLIHAVGQPDLHPGTKFPIGAVFVSQGWIHPPLIGGDIGCGMAWYKTALSRNQVDGDKGKKVAEKLRGLEGPWRTNDERRQWLTEHGECFAAGEEWDKSLGTIGAGNHFAEIQVVEDVQDGLPFQTDEVVLLVHSGSRGYGGDILKRYTNDGHTSLREGEETTEKYMEEHDRACRWAQANRDLIALRFLACLEPGDSAWDLGHNDFESESDTDSAAAIEAAQAMIQQRKVVDIWHNNVQRVAWPPKSPFTTAAMTETITEKVAAISDPSALTGLASATSSLSLSASTSPTATTTSPTSPTSHPPRPPAPTHAHIHRKGAAPTCSPLTALPLPLLPLPGSRATPTAILSPTFSAATHWGAHNGLSLAHGAGRAMSRAKALSSLSAKYGGDVEGMVSAGAGAGGKAKKERKGVDAGGTWDVCEDKQLVWEEAPEAYKDVRAVAGDLVAAGVAAVRGWCGPRVCYKVRNE